MGEALLALVLLAAASEAATPPPTLLGTYYGNQGWAMGDVRAMESWQGRRNAVVELFTDWNGSRKTLDNLFKQQLPNIWANGNVPLLTWEPFTSASTPADVEVRIARGDYDGYVRTWAGRLAGFLAGADGRLGTPDDRRVYLRLAHEANGDWYPWGAAMGVNQPSDYVAMWQRVHGLVAAAGLGPTTVQWVWAVNGDDVGGFRAEDFYPGDASVDWVAVDAYNWGASQSWSSWKPAADVLGPMVTRLRALAPGKPLGVTETASTSATSAGPSVTAKSAWISDLYGWAPANGVGMVVWFDTDKETDWAVFGGSAGDETFKSGRTTYRAYSAYRTSVGSASYAGADPANPRILTDDQFAGR
ncbi:MAG TPA: glycosyl hydrolase [Acidimicrobiales bacterium]|nr:glycosyl hydrolase [Acidimicrobiales bacterium]